MRTFKGLILIALAVLSLSACEQHIAVDTVVHEDGSLDRTIILAVTDSADIDRNIFGLSATNGWDVSTEAVSDQPEPSKKDSVKSPKGSAYNVIFKKTFHSAEESNSALNVSSDSLFQIETNFSKQFRWFYTYMTFSETYKAIDRFHFVSAADYFTAEDQAFIDRLPAEGKPVSRSDSLFLTQLNSKIFDVYATRGIFEEYFHGFLKLLGDNNVEQRWADSLQRHKEKLFRDLISEKIDGPDDQLMIIMAERVGIPLPASVRDAYQVFSKKQERLTNFMSDAASGNYKHTIHMPWTIISSNADSVSGNTVTWHPPVTKFLVSDHTFSVQARKMNTWAIVVSVMFVIGSVWLVIKRNKD